jgi:excisionase family DNA binding protein
MTTAQTADYLGVSRAFLERDRITLQTIPFVRLGSRSIRYRKADLDAHLLAMRVHAAP